MPLPDGYSDIPAGKIAAVVTHLEMTARRSPRDDPPGAFDHPAALAFYQRSGFRPFRRQIEVADDPRLDGTMPRDAARHVPVIG
jgi:hypothetical protein